MTDREAMQALIDGREIQKQGITPILHLSKEGVLQDQSGYAQDFIGGNPEVWKIYESREDKIKRLATDLDGKFWVGKYEEGKKFQNLLNLILEDG